MDLDKVIDCMPRVPMAMVTNLPGPERDPPDQHGDAVLVSDAADESRDVPPSRRLLQRCGERAIARRLTNRQLIAKSGVQPFQSMMAYRMSDLLPGVVRAASLGRRWKSRP